MMKMAQIIIHIIILYGIYLLGNWIQDIFQLFIPGSVIGMGILFLLLLLGIVKESWLEKGSSFLIKHLAFFFVPATVGIMTYFSLFKGQGIFLIFIVLISTIFVMISAGYVGQWLSIKKTRRMVHPKKAKTKV